ncbi:MAG TPA: hypothetical protein VF426_01215 [Marmoricola sp.]
MRRITTGFVLTLGLVLGATVLVATPANAARSWKNLYVTARHVKAQACRLTRTSEREHLVAYGADARKAAVAGSVQLKIKLTPYQPGQNYIRPRWLPFRAHAMSADIVGFSSDRRAKVFMRVRTKYGTSRWSRGFWWSSLPWCA